jgi:hypothetical protein
MNAADRYRLQARSCREGISASPFYAELLDALADDAERGGPAARVLAPIDDLPVTAATPLRLLGGVHRAVLAGRLPELAARFPSTGGDGDAPRAVPALVAVLDDPPADVVAALGRDPQTNEVGRAAALAVGLAVAARRGDAPATPLRILEIGASAGLNLRLDRFAYAVGGAVWGDLQSPVRFDRPGDYEGRPPFRADVAIIERRGCDLHPIDATGADAAHTLLGYVWPDQQARLERLRGALEIAAAMPVTIDAAAAGDWVDEHAHPRPGVATVVFHSVMWQYLPKEERHRIRTVLIERGAAATPDAPFAWLRLEPSRDWTGTELRILRWPGGTDELLATSGYHGPPVRYLPTLPA